MTRHLVPSPLGTTHVLEDGPPAAPAIVLLHQTPRSVDEYAEMIPQLAATHHVIAIDTPGYGCSDQPAAQPSISDYAAVVVAVLDALGVEHAHIAGHHTGGIIAVELAAAFPDRVLSVTISGPIFMNGAARASLRPLFVQWHVQPDGSHLMDKWDRFTKWIAPPALLQRLVVDLFRAGETSEFGHLAVAEYCMEDRLPLVRCPALLVYGTRDPFADRPHEAVFTSAFRPTRSVAIDGGVFLPNEAPDAFAGAILDFVGGLPIPAAAAR